MKPGEFHGTCRLSRWVPIEELLEVDPDSTTSRWDHKLGCSVFAVQCSFETADKAAFDKHMLEVHQRKLGTYEGAKPGHFTRSFSPQVKRPRIRKSTPSAGPDEGKPFVDKAGVTQTCPSCGLVAEMGGHMSNEIWWTEHLRECQVLVPS